MYIYTYIYVYMYTHAIAIYNPRIPVHVDSICGVEQAVGIRSVHA